MITGAGFLQGHFVFQYPFCGKLHSKAIAIYDSRDFLLLFRVWNPVFTPTSDLRHSINFNKSDLQRGKRLRVGKVS